MNKNIKKPFLLVDSSYVSFHRFFSTLIWFNNIHPNIEITEDYDWIENKIFMNHFDETYMKNLLKYKSMYNIPFENIVIVRDCPRENIWRMDIYKEYKATRKNTCSYKNKKYNIGCIFKHIYNELYPKLEKQYGFKIIKIDNAEADDIIAVLAHKIRELDKNRLVVIISNDNDYLQLVNERTLIWSLQNKLLNTKVETTADELLLRKVLRGDESDNIPSLVGSMGEKELTEIVRDKLKLAEWFKLNPDKYEMYENNKKLIDFSYIPEKIKNIILEEAKNILSSINENNEEIVNPEIKIEEPKPVVVTVPSIPFVEPEIIKKESNKNFKFKQDFYQKPFYQKFIPSHYINYKNYGVIPSKTIGMTNSFFQNRYINYATEDYYKY